MVVTGTTDKGKPAQVRAPKALRTALLPLWVAMSVLIASNGAGSVTANAADGDAMSLSAGQTPSAGMTQFAPYSVPETHQVRVVLLNTADGLAGALQLNLLLTRYRRQALETSMGLRLEVLNISNAQADHIEHSVLYYRPGFLRPALILAEVIPGEQTVEPMPPNALAKETVDIQILVGKELP